MNEKADTKKDQVNVKWWDKYHIDKGKSLPANVQGYKDIYSPMIFKCTQEFVLVMFHSYRALTNRRNITILSISQV